MSLDVGPAIRSTIIGDAPIAMQLADYGSDPAVFAFRPIPKDAEPIYIIVNPDASITDQDGLRSSRPVLVRDIAIYGNRAAPGDTSDQSPVVETLGYAIRELFHRKKFSVQLAGYSTIDVVASGPVPAPVDDDGTVGRMVTLTIRLRRNP